MAHVITKARLGNDPELSTHNLDGQEKTVAEFRAYCLKPVPPKNDGDEWKDEGYWVSVSIWGDYAQSCGKHLKKGNLVRIEGTQISEKWTDDQDNRHDSLRIKARTVDPVLTQLDSVNYRSASATARESTPA